MITPVDVLAPKGRVQAKFFPEDSAEAFTARLEAYIAEGYALGGDDVSVPLWVYHRAFSDAYEATLLDPARMEAGSYVEEFSKEQRHALKSRADEYLERWTAATAPSSPTPGTYAQRPEGSGSVRTRFTF